MLLQFDPLRELDRVFEQSRANPVLPMDAVRRGNTVFAFFDLPGVDPGSVHLEVERNVLTVRAERRWERQDGDQVLANERRQGSFVRRLLLGDTLDAEQVQADSKNGVPPPPTPVATQPTPP